MTLLEDIRKRFPNKILYVQKEAYRECKDANEILQKHGKEAVRKAVENAIEQPVKQVVELADAVEEVESCSACYGYLIPALEMLKEEGLFEKLDEKICIGQGYRGKTGVLGVGHCTCKFQNFVEGCPPLEGEIYEFLKRYVNERTPGK